MFHSKLKFHSHLLKCVKLTSVSLLLGLIGIACTDPKDYLLQVSQDKPIYLNNIDSVGKYLHGFWIPEEYIDEDYILWLDVNQKKQRIDWSYIPFDPSYKTKSSIPTNSCGPVVDMLLINHEVYLEFVGLIGSDTVKIDYLSNNKLRMDSTTYLRHQGYSFL